MRRFFLPTSHLHDSQAVIDGTEFHHLRHVLRLQVGDSVLLCDDRGAEYQGTIATLSSTSAEVTITHTTPATPRFSLTLAQGLLKGRKMDVVIEKATEIGVSRIVPLITKFTVAQLREGQQQDRLQRWHRIARSAAKQSGSPVPHLAPPQSLAEFLHSIADDTPTLLFHEKARRETLKHFAERQPILLSLHVIVGTEGGFTEEEVEQARLAGCHILSLGSHVLRAETASLVTVSLCQFLWGTAGLPPLPER
ncbi:MAG: 16S rRNA (uracil(1498)-N(3))-methyltransferase [Deltaproteobacteria bacterium]|nr:16S rRNA (uracil(1498)-N(3))-methyltransferase [Deltaproteobacteria bacterium]